jgi:AcrR family transcriptional regulator
MQIEKKNKIDRRIQRTRQALHAALFELIKKKGYDAISTEEITEQANVARATFYLHYKDKEDLLLEEFNEMANETVQMLSEIPFDDWLPKQGFNESDPGKSISSSRPLLVIFNHIKDHSEIYYILLKSSKSGRVMERIRKISTEAITQFVKNKLKTEPVSIEFKVPVELFAAYFSGAMLSTVDWWLEEGMHHSPEEMTKLFRDIFFYGVKATIGLSSDKNQ